MLSKPRLCAAALAIIGPGAPGSTAKVCLSKEEAARPAEPRLNPGCTRDRGRPQQTEMPGKWLAADCGDVKPRAMPSK